MELRIFKEFKEIDRIIQQALKEDIGKVDITTAHLIPEDKHARAILICNQDNVIICGLPIAERVFKSMDKNILFESKVKEGALIKKDRVVALLEGRAKSILTAERTALNFLSLLSGIATFTYRFKEKIKPYKVKILDTRKTHPNLRVLEKYAVRIGGGCNHRFRLDEMFLVKDNHIKLLGGIEGVKNILKKLKKKITRNILFEIETKSIKEFRAAQELKPDIIMLDNLSLKEIKRIMKIKSRGIKIEVSGNVNLKNIKSIAKTGVDMISIGAITHSAKSVDFSLEII
ncbi:MAG: carboxylating nicotinate-nucleotide diphosphorylase [Candidatus Omnitrophica bacterium]|nr:carboxylating nicotinate-nucleotide diphosphorylase [Candidatus Omnitrophota bacterium]